MTCPSFRIAAILSPRSHDTMKIAFVLYDYYPFGGLQEDCLATAMATQAKGHEVHIFTRTWQGEIPTTINQHLLGKKGWTNTSRDGHFINQLDTELPKYDLDRIVAFNRIPHADIYFAADPCFKERTIHYSWRKKLSPRYRYFAQLEETIFMGPNAPETLVLTENEIDSFRKHYQLPRERFHLLPPGVDKNNTNERQKIINRTKLRKENGTSNDIIVALFVGSGFRIKGLDRALRSIAANSKKSTKLEFWVVGDGKHSRYKSLANKAGVNVRFLGGRADVNRFYDAADFLLHPAYSESAGKVLLEALTHGLPVLTTDTCGYAPHILKADAGAVIDSPFTQAKLDNMVERFICQDEARLQWSKNALKYAASHDLYSCHESAAKLIEEL